MPPMLLNTENLNDLLPALESLSLSELEKIYASLSGYETIPVDIETFIDHPDYLGKCFEDDEDGIRFFPYWREFLKRVYPNSFVSENYLVVLRGAIGQGKTVALCIGLAYQMHKLLCYTNPQKSVGLLPADKIRFAIFNATLSLASDVVLDRLTSFFTTSPYFTSLLESNVSFTTNHRKKKKTDSLFPKGIDLFAGSRVGHSLGKAIFSAVIDEANFDVISDQFFTTLNSLLARMESRFMNKGGGFPGQIWVASSETDKTSNLNKLLDQYRGKKGVIVSNVPIWKVKPHKYVLNKIFPVFIGSETQQPYIITENNKILLITHPDRIIDVPEEHRDRFEADVNAALRDLAGVSTSGAYKLFRLKEKIISSLQMVALFPDIIRIDFEDDDDTIDKHCFNSGYFTNPIQKQMPRYFSIDISYAEGGDRFGVSASYIGGWKEIKVRNPHTLTESVELSPITYTDFAFAVESKPGQQIPIYKVRQFLLWLTQQGYIIGKVTADSASGMSADFIQQVKKMGFETELVSVDKTSLPYISFRSAVYEDRWRGPTSSLLRAELEELEITPDGKKVDHLKKSPGSNIVGSKDVADSVCQGIYKLQMETSKFSMLATSNSMVAPPISTPPEIAEMFWGNQRR